MKLSESLESVRREVDSLSAQTSELTQGKIRKFFIYNFMLPTSRTFCLVFMVCFTLSERDSLREELNALEVTFCEVESERSRLVGSKADYL